MKKNVYAFIRLQVHPYRINGTFNRIIDTVEGSKLCILTVEGAELYILTVEGTTL